MIKCRLRVLLAERDLSQKDLSVATGVNINTISKMCRNDIERIPVKALYAICEYLGCNVSDVLVIEKP